MEWKSMADIKEAKNQILATDGEKVYLTRAAWIYKDPNGNFGIPANHGRGATITHWMPLPKLP